MALLVVLVLAPASASARTGLRRELERMRRDVGAPGGVLLLDDGRRVRRVAVGVADRRSRRAMPLDARFRVHSVTDMFVAAVVLQFAAEDRLSLDDSVDRWLPGRVPDAGGVTIGRMLNHTSGISDVGLRGPVGRFLRAHENYRLLGDVVQAVTGAPLGDELQRRIFSPLALRDTSWPHHSSVRGLVRGYELANGKDVTRQDPATFSGDDGIVSSARGLRRFLRGLFGGALLGPRELTAMLTPVPVEPHSATLEDGYGMGVHLHRTRCGHVWGGRGRGVGYSPFVFASPDGRRSVIALFNAGAASDPTAIRVQHLMFRAYCAGR